MNGSTHPFCLKKVVLLSLILYILVQGCLVPVSAVPFPYGEPEYYATVSGDNRLIPGNVTPLEITLTNIAHAPEKVLDPVNPVPSSPVVGIGLVLILGPGTAPVEIVSSPLTIPVLPPSVKVPLVFPVIVPADAKAGNYTLSLQVNSWYTDSIAMEGTGTNVFHYQPKNVSVQVPVRIKPVVQVIVTDIIASNMSPGQHGRVSATLTNIGDCAGKNAIAELVPDKSSPVFPYQGSFFLGTLTPGEKRDVSWRMEVLDDIDTTTVPSTVVVSYEDEDGLTVTSEPAFIGIPISSGPKFSISYDKPVIEPGGRASVLVTYHNTGDAPAHHATAKIVPISPVSSPVTTALFETVQPGEAAEVVYEFSLNQKALVKPYGVLTDVKYLGEDQMVAISDPMKIEIETVPPGILTYLFSPIALVIILGVILILGYFFLRWEGRLV